MRINDRERVRNARKGIENRIKESLVRNKRMWRKKSKIM